MDRHRVGRKEGATTASGTGRVKGAGNAKDGFGAGRRGFGGKPSFSRVSARGYLLVLLPLAVLMLVAAVHFDATRIRAYTAELRGDVADRMDAQRARIEGRVTGLSLMLRGLEAAIEADPEISQARYAALARIMIRDNPEILNIAAAPGLVVKYVYPEGQNASLIGLDYRKQPAQYGAISEAEKTGQTILAGPLKLLQNGHPGFIVRMPVFLGANVGPERGSFWGVVSLVIDAQTFYLRSGLLGAHQAVSFALRGPDGTGAAGPVFWGDPSIFDQHPMVQNVALPHGTWQLGAIPQGGWPDLPPDTWLVRLAMLLVALAALTGVWLVLHLLRSHRLAREQLLNAIGAIDDGFALYDADDRLVLCNDKYREYYTVSSDLIRPGAKFEYMIREGVRRGQYPEARGREEEWVAKRMAAHRRADSMVEQQLADGRWLRISERRMSDGSTVGFRVDVTELKRAKDAAEAANRTKADFLSVLSHELRTPMTVILGFARFLSDRNSSAILRKRAAAQAQAEAAGEPAPAMPELFESYIEEVTQRASKIETSGSHLLLLINDLLDFSKIEAGKLDLEREFLPLGVLVDDVLGQLAPQAEDKGIQLISEIGEEEVFADTIRLRQVLLNLIGNAVKFTDVGTVTISAVRTKDEIAISVADTGCGIPEDMTEKVFQEFQQADSSSTRRAGGTGLGLAIVRRIVELHDGKVTLTSRLDEGSTFTFTLPIPPQPPVPQPGPARGGASRSQPSRSQTPRSQTPRSGT